MKNISVNLIISTLSFPLLIWLQIFPSKHKNKILGLVLPTLSVLSISIPRIITMVSFGIDKGEFFNVIIPMILILNIPTVIFIVCRKRVRINKEIEKMNIQDLE